MHRSFGTIHVLRATTNGREFAGMAHPEGASILPQERLDLGVPSSTPREERHALRRLILLLGPPAASKTSGHCDTVDLPLTLVGITLLSAEEAHRFLVVDVLRTIDDLDDFLQSTNGVLAKQNMPDHFFEGAVLWIPVTPDFN